MSHRQKLMQIHELQSLAAPDGVVRIPPEWNVPLSHRVARLLDTPPVRRLGRISQLGLVSLVYPGATHSRMEHSLGVYRNALLFLQRLSVTDRFAEVVDARNAKRFLVAALLHDVGHWPFCHPIEDMRLDRAIRHEQRASQLICDPAIADCLADDWDLQPDEIVSLLHGEPQTDQDRVLTSLLSGPIDVDKTDYLIRDSLHAGVPYGRNFDVGRLIGSLVIPKNETRLAISDKGRTAAEMMVFSRYIMFSEVYWHHTVRSATAMFQRAIFMLKDHLDLDSMFELTDAPFIDHLLQVSRSTPASALVEGLFGAERRLHKQLVEFSVLDSPDIHRQLARLPYESLVRCSETFVDIASQRLGESIERSEVLIDAPPLKLEVDINVQVLDRSGAIRTLGDVSPVAAVLSKQQFDHYVKRVRVFVSDRVRRQLSATQSRDILEHAI